MAGPYLVLANSRKLGAHCVAVVGQGGRWIRPVSNAEHGELTTAQCMLADGSRALAVLDVVEADLGAPRVATYQPEDHAAPLSWRLSVPQPSPAQVAAWIEATVDHGADFLARGRQDRIRETDITAAKPLQSSLALVKPTNPTWRVQKSMSGSRQTRVSFTLDSVVDWRGGSIPFDLVVTDPVWEMRVQNLAQDAIREVTAAELGIDGDQPMFLTVSLGEPFLGNHYKLVAAVIV